jgi:hypothetical protein
MNPDEHFEIDAWVDFARGVCSPAQRITMEEHMATCLTCSEMAEFLGKVWQTGRGMKEENVPQKWSRKAEQILNDQTLTPIRQLPAHSAVLAFDSFNALAPDPVRAGPSSARHMTYNALLCVVELKVDQNLERHNVSIVGQITDRRTPDRAIPRTSIFLLTGDKVLATTSSNEFGEFQLECKPQRRLLISFPFDGSRINVILDHLFSRESRHP